VFPVKSKPNLFVPNALSSRQYSKPNKNCPINNLYKKCRTLSPIPEYKPQELISEIESNEYVDVHFPLATTKGLPPSFQEKLKQANSYPYLAKIFDKHLDLLGTENVRKTIEALTCLYEQTNVKPSVPLLRNIANKVIPYLEMFSFDELKNFVQKVYALEGTDHFFSDMIKKYTAPRQYYIAHLNPRLGSGFWIHPTDDFSVEGLVNSNNLCCPKCHEVFKKNPNFSLIKSSENFSHSLGLEQFQEDVKPINILEIKRWTEELTDCIQNNNWHNFEILVAHLLQNGGKFSAQMREMVHKSSCSYQILKTVINLTKTVTLDDFRLAFDQKYPSDMIAFMCNEWLQSGRKSFEEIISFALEKNCSLKDLEELLKYGGKIVQSHVRIALETNRSLEDLEELLKFGGEIDLSHVRIALDKSSFEVIEFVIAHYKKGTLSAAWDLPYLDMEKLPKDKWEFVFSKLEDPFQEYSMYTILNHFLSLNILREKTPIEIEAAQFFLDKGGYIPESSLKPILMSNLSEEMKLNLLERWTDAGGIVTDDLIAFALTPKTYAIECKNSMKIILYLFSRWTCDQEKIPKLLKVAARYPGFVDFVKILMDRSENLEFVEEFLKHEYALEIVQYFLEKGGKVPSNLIPTILHSDLSNALKLEIVKSWIKNGGEVSFEILHSVFFSASYRNLHEIIDYILPLWNVDPEKTLSLIGQASLGGASPQVIKFLIDCCQDLQFGVRVFLSSHC
jgi:hypothetical protein